MNGMNRLFETDPVAFLSRICVDNKAEMFRTDGLNAADMQALNTAKHGTFDFDSPNSNVNVILAPSTGVAIRRIAAVAPVNDVGINAYWCPFLAGAANQIGWVDVPRRAPQHRFIFTAAMQGCCYVVTNSPASPQHFRVWHNQHPDTALSWQSISASGATTVYSQLTYQQYGGSLVNAFNILVATIGTNYHDRSLSRASMSGAESHHTCRGRGLPARDSSPFTWFIPRSRSRRS